MSIEFSKALNIIRDCSALSSYILELFSYIRRVARIFEYNNGKDLLTLFTIIDFSHDIDLSI